VQRTQDVRCILEPVRESKSRSTSGGLSVMLRTGAEPSL